MRRALIPILILIALPLAGCETMAEVEAAVTSSVESVEHQLFGTEEVKETSQNASSKEGLPKRVPGQLVSEISIAGRITPQDVADGDTITLKGQKIRLHGIDAPELSQQCEVKGARTACGTLAKQALIGFLVAAEVRCDRKDVDRYGRYVSICFVDGTDVSAAMVRAGLAVAYRQYSMDYVAEEEAARQHKIGLWKGKFDMPWDWRRQRRI